MRGRVVGGAGPKSGMERSRGWNMVCKGEGMFALPTTLPLLANQPPPHPVDPPQPGPIPDPPDPGRPMDPPLPFPEPTAPPTPFDPPAPQQTF
jgi:hypothetical protein